MPQNRHQVFALLVGVNRHKRDPGKLKPKDLSGCEHDVELMEDLLDSFKQKRDIRIEKLLNEEASYEAVISSFRRHFAQARPGDTALFYYSGHGTREKRIPDAFHQYFHADRSEGLVCHDGCTTKGFILADKELAVLISEIPEGVHVVVILDSCHSGSGTREEHVRMTDPVDKDRSLDQYLDGWFSDQLDQMGEIRLPQREHILIAAADRMQKAREQEFDGKMCGVFTRFLCKTASDQSLNYRQLTNRVEDLLRANRFRQQPQLEPVGGASVYSRFLLGEKSREVRYARIYWKAGFRMKPGSWRLELGAVHGLSFDKVRNIRIPVYAEDGTRLGFGNIEELGLQDSVFKPGSDVQLDKEQVYKSQVLGRLLSVSIQTEDQHALIAELGDGFELPSGIEFVEAGGKYSLKKEGSAWEIVETKAGQKLCTVKGEGSAVFAFNQIQNIARYESLLMMQSPGASQLPPGNLEFEIRGLGAEIEKTAEGEYHCRVAADASNTIPYQLVAKHHYNEDIYTSLFSLDPDFSIKELNLDADLRQAGERIHLYHASLGSLAHAPRVIETWFVLIASRAPIQAGTFVQAGLPLSGLWGELDLDAPASSEHREGGLRIRRSGFGRGSQSAADWALKRIVVRIEKR
jgi:hypothetical protein